MAHSSLPIYLDPSNWQQQSNQHPTNDHQDPRQLPQFLPPPPSQPPHISGVAGSIRPGSMAYRARLAMIPQPEAALKCPRCESTNTKFCYFNNYSLSQPRHFCKTCRRYWTRGGALRNVPVGGGFRKNKKKKKSNRSKSPAATEMEMMNNSRSNSAIMSAGCNIGSGTIGHLATQSLQLPSMAASLQINLPRFGSGNNSGSGLNFNGIQMGGELDQWRSQQYPFIVAGLESPSAAGYSLIPNEATFGGNNNNNNTSTVQYCHQVQNLTPPFCRERERESHQLKNEEKQNQNQNQAGIANFLRPPAAIVTTENNNNNQFWTSHDQSSWTDLSALSSSSSSHLL